MSVIVYEELERRVKGAMTFIDVAVAHLKSALASSPSVTNTNIELALAWLLDAKSELQAVLNVTARNAVVLVDSATVARLRKARVRQKEAVEALFNKCIEEYVSERG